MEHGLDARFPCLHAARSDLPTFPSGKYYLLAPLRFSGAFHSGVESRRSCPWETLAALENARGCLAKVRQFTDVLCLDVRTSGEKASFYGWRIRAMAGMEPRRGIGLGVSAIVAARWGTPPGSTSELSL